MKRENPLQANTRPTAYWDEDGPLVLNNLTVFDGPDYTVHTGLLDANGKPITYQVETMGKIGFVHFPDRDDETDENEEDEA